MTLFYMIAAFLAFIWNILPITDKLPGLSSYLYCAAIIGWSLTIRYRIIHRKIRRLLLIGAAILIAMFVMHLCRFEFFPYSVSIRQYMRYGYHVCFMLVSMIALMVALCVGRSEDDRPLRYARFLWIPQFALCAVILTNTYHQQMFGITPFPREHHTYHWFYYVTVVCEIVLGILTLVILFRRSLFLTTKRKWYIPAFFVTAGILLMLIYFVSGGSPSIAGIQIYDMQEAFSFLFVAGFESAIRIGMIPSNTGYQEVFYNSHINALLYDHSHEVMYSSLGYRSHTGMDNRVRTKNVRGGTVLWIEDLSTINRLNEELLQTTEQVEEENDLIRQENELRRERIGYETRNRIYDRIATVVRPQALQIQSLLTEEPDLDRMRENLLFAVVLGTYIKRLGNLLLIAEENPMIRTGELGISIRESFEYLSLSGCACTLSGEEASELRADAVLYAYAVFESVIEKAYAGMHACMVTFENTDPQSAFAMRIVVDTDFSFDADAVGIRRFGRINTWEEDGESYLELVIPGQGMQEVPYA
ncbi:MAG: hypothetical protein J5518_07960 [Lachnospiraceae bacterium]|nr:hypothetical protein [Lachnospiraceae bacterium]